MPRRKLETAIGKLFIPTLVGLALGTIPYVPYYLEKHYVTQGTITGLFGLAAGVLSALYGYYTFLRNIVASLIGQIAATVGAILYLYATLVFAYFLIVLLINAGTLASGSLTLMRLP
jgi:Fe2+ transport system protein B